MPGDAAKWFCLLNSADPKWNGTTEVPGEVAGGADHVLAGDVALVGPDKPLAVRLLLDAGHGRVPIDLRAVRPGAVMMRCNNIGGFPVLGNAAPGNRRLAAAPRSI